MIRTSEGTFVIAGMCVLKENFYPPEEAREHFKVIPPGGHTDLFQSYGQMMRLKEIGGDNVLPLHMTESWEMGRIGELEVPAARDVNPAPDTDQGGESPASETEGGVLPAEETQTQPERQVAAQAETSQLPMTGFAAIPVLLGGLALLAGGLILRRRSS